MKWVKHFTATWDDEKIARLVKSGGVEGLAAYGLWWRIVEIVAGKMDANSQVCSITYDVTRWSSLLSLRGSHVRHWLEKLAVTTLLTVEWSGTEVTVTIPNLLKYRDEYSAKSRHSPKQEVEVEQKKKEIEKPAPRPVSLEEKPEISATPKNGSAPKERSSRFKESELPGKWRDWCVEQLNWDQEHVAKTYQRFSCYWLAQGGQRARKLDWYQAWQYWCHQEPVLQQNGSFRKAPTRQEMNELAFERAKREN